ncbi:hypothetical protein DMP17_10855 [Pseudonocardia sp. TMWB2A]
MGLGGGGFGAGLGQIYRGLPVFARARLIACTDRDITRFQSDSRIATGDFGGGRNIISCARQIAFAPRQSGRQEPAERVLRDQIMRLLQVRLGLRHIARRCISAGAVDMRFA